jgi:uncharacterized protein YndB with AHSA1/START domain
MSETSSAATTFTKLSDLEYEMSRLFDAPRELVFRVCTDPQHIPHWWGPRSVTTVVDEMDVRPGGKWRYVHRDPDGTEYGFHGEYREVVPPERLVSTFEFEGMPGHVVVDTVTFTEENGRTRLTSKSTFESAADLEGMLATGAESGAIETWERLAELLTRLQQNQHQG